MIFLDIFKSYRGDEIWTLNVLFWNPKKKKCLWGKRLKTEESNSRMNSPNLAKQRKVGKFQGLHLPKESKKAKGRLPTPKIQRIREWVAKGRYKTCKGGGRKFSEEDTSHLRIQYSTLT